MTQPPAGPSTPLWGGRFGCPGRAQFAIFFAASVFCASAQSQQFSGVEPQLALDRTELRAGDAVIDTQIARTSQEQQIGLMHRMAMPRDEGMLFVFQGDRKRCVWMHDTDIPLSAAWLDAAGRVVGLVDLSPRSDEIHCSTQPARYMLEMNQGWFVRAGVDLGSSIEGLPSE